jgi:hypothetical protein
MAYCLVAMGIQSLVKTAKDILTGDMNIESGISIVRSAINIMMWPIDLDCSA